MCVTQTLYTDIVPSLFVVFLPFCPQTDTAQLYNTQSDLCMRTHLIWIKKALLSTIVFSGKRVLSSHHTRLLTRHLKTDMVAERSSSKLQAHRSHRSTKDLAPVIAHTSETALADAVNHTVNMIMENASLRCTYLRSRAQPR